MLDAPAKTLSVTTLEEFDQRTSPVAAALGSTISNAVTDAGHSKVIVFAVAWPFAVP
jgi:hypothetical protein